jgi:hypothetical protein
MHLPSFIVSPFSICNLTSVNLSRLSCGAGMLAAPLFRAFFRLILDVPRLNKRRLWRCLRFA